MGAGALAAAAGLSQLVTVLAGPWPALGYVRCVRRSGSLLCSTWGRVWTTAGSWC